MTGNDSLFETLRLRVEADVAARLDKRQYRRPSWAPPLVLGDELFDICIKLGLLTADDKPIGRLWAQFANPKKVGRVLREANWNKEHAMVGIACRGFELHAGGERGNKSAVLFQAQRYGDNKWETGPRWIEPYGSPSRATCRAQLAEAQAVDKQKYRAALERYELRRRATEFAGARVAELAGDYDVQIRSAGRLCGHCCECFRLLTDPRSLEIGIGPECVQKVVWISPQGKFVRMIDAIADGRITVVNGELRWVAAS
jgi:hypothetical protein